MNINQLKAFLGEKPPHLGNESNIQNPLRESALRQAESFQANQTALLKADQFSSSASLGVRVYANSLHSTLEVNSLKPNFTFNKSSQSATPGFDFEEVAKNVLKFVGGAIKNAKSAGADDDKLTKMFEQATSGVLKGIKLAEKDLAGFMNDEIRSGISNSQKLIEDGIAKLKQEIFAQPQDQNTDNTQTVSSATQINVSQQQSGKLLIKTKDGDEVSLSFEDIKRFELNQQLSIVNQQVQPQAKDDAVGGVNNDVKTTANDVSEATPVEAEPAKQPNDVADAQAEPASNSVTVNQNSVYYQSNSLAMTVSGELDEQELASIAKLVGDANDLADEFFHGDIETAYNQALKLGFDDQELTSFALQLTKVENTQVIKAYETVSHYDQDNSTNDPAKAVKPVAHYLDKMLGVVEESRLKLQDGNDYENMINELINRMGEVHTPDLIHAINRFHSFNQKLLDNLPLSFKVE